MKSFHFMGTKFSGLTMKDMFVDTWICWFQIIRNIIKVKNHFDGFLKSRIPLSTKKQEIKYPTNKNDFTVFHSWIPPNHKKQVMIQRKKMISQFYIHGFPLTTKNK